MVRRRAARRPGHAAGAGGAGPGAAGGGGPRRSGVPAPGDMPARIAAAARRTGQRPPADPPAVVRCILDSLALAYRARLRDVQELSGRAVDTVHVVGGGVRNALLLQLTADACGLPVVAGPAEAAALGNVLVQARDARRGAWRPGRDARPAARDPAAAPLRAVRRARRPGTPPRPGSGSDARRFTRQAARWGLGECPSARRTASVARPRPAAGCGGPAPADLGTDGTAPDQGDLRADGR